MFKKMILQIDRLLDRHTGLLIGLAILVMLRIPNFFDPYWYGDEAIYLTLGQSIRAGKGLYSEIVDHKTPLIYYLATVPNQFWFRILLLGWMIISTILFYDISNKIFKNKITVWVSSLAFILLTTLPTFEGHIPNGELFVMGFIILGLWIITRSGYLPKMLASEDKTKVNFLPLFVAGLFFGLALLIKVPALLDFAGLLLLAWFPFSKKVLHYFRSIDKLILKRNTSFWEKVKYQALRCKNYIINRKTLSLMFYLAKHWLPVFLGLLLPILLSIIYFIAIGSGADYLRFGLLYNLHYSQTWTHDFGSSLVNFLFTLPGKTLILAIFLLILTLIKSIPIKTKFLSGWYLLTLYSVLLSNRPYPHYFLQTIVPLVLLLSYLLDLLLQKNQDAKEKLTKLLSTTLVIFTTATLTLSILITLNFGTYSTSKYYRNYYRHISGEISQAEYFQTFNVLMKDNYQLAEFLKERREHKLFIWGNNPMLYALSQTIPSSRYIVAFHVLDMNAYDETITQVINDQPKYIVLMHDAPTNFPEFYQYLSSHYIPNYSYSHMTLYKRVNQL